MPAAAKADIATIMANSSNLIANFMVLSPAKKGRTNSRNVQRVSDGCTCLRLIMVRFTVIAVITER